MNSFLDTSSLVKLYDSTEPDASALQQALDPQGIIYLSTLTEIEFASVLNRKRNRGELDAEAAQALQEQFEATAQAYGWVEQTPALRRLAVQLIQKHRSLRSLDAIQLACALAAGPLDAFFTHDQHLRAAALAEGLPVR